MTHIFLTGGALSCTGVAVDPHGMVYLADRTAFTEDGTGRVVRLSE